MKFNNIFYYLLIFAALFFIACDSDDDNDGYLTRFEIKNLTATPIYTYPFDEIPTCGGSGNGKKRHLDKTCHN